MNSSYWVLTLTQISFLGFIVYQLYKNKMYLLDESKDSEFEIEFKKSALLTEIDHKKLPDEFYVRAQTALKSQEVLIKERRRILNQLQHYGSLDHYRVGLSTDVKETITHTQSHKTQETTDFFDSIDDYIFKTADQLDPSDKDMTDRLQ